MISHNFVVGTCDVTFNEELNDYVFVKIIFYFVSTDDSAVPKKTVSTMCQLDLSNPDTTKFIACKDVDRETKKQWVQSAIAPIEQKLIDVNLAKLQMA